MKGSVLIADDEPLARRTLRQYLLDLGWAGLIHDAPDGDAAIAVANAQRPDLLFLDIVMPGATGLEVFKRLDYEPKVIFTTAHDQYAVTAFELGLHYLLKPFGRDRLERVLRRAQAALDETATPLLNRATESMNQSALSPDSSYAMAIASSPSPWRVLSALRVRMTMSRSALLRSNIS